MESKIAAAIGFRYGPVAVVLTDEKPGGALQFKEGRWGCVAASFTAAAKKRRPAVFDRSTFGCLGGGTGLGFGNQYTNFPGGIEYYISTGNQEFALSEAGKNLRTSTPLDEGERYVISPEIAGKFINSLPMTEVPTTYVAFVPLEQVTPDAPPRRGCLPGKRRSIECPDRAGPLRPGR